MSSLREIKFIISSYKSTLQERFKLKSIGVFGLYAKRQAEQDSAIDIVVEFTSPVGIEFIDLIIFLEDVLKNKIALVSRDGVAPEMLRYLEEDLIYV